MVKIKTDLNLKKKIVSITENTKNVIKSLMTIILFKASFYAFYCVFFLFCYVLTVGRNEGEVNILNFCDF